MLVGMNQTRTILDEMHASHFEFHLTGSRFFGGSNERSDFDFYCEDNPEIVKWLKERGFSKVKNGSYTDDMCCSSVFLWESQVYDKDGRMIENPHPNVHVQLTQNIGIKTWVQNVLKKRGLLRLNGLPVSKAIARLIWNTAYNVYWEVMQDSK